MSSKKKVPKVALSPIGEYCEAMMTHICRQGKTIPADIGKALSMIHEADHSFLAEYRYLEFCLRTCVRSQDLDLLQFKLQIRIEKLFAGLAAYKAALDAALPRGLGNTSRGRHD